MPSSLSHLAQQILPVLYQHRLVATSQLHRLLTPNARRPVYLRNQLSELRRLGLADATTRRITTVGRPQLLWFCSSLGAELVESAGEVTARAYRISPEIAASQLQEHTLAVVETGTAFVTWARHFGDDCTPLDWEPELAHRIRDGDRLGEDALLIPDSVLRYTRTVDDGLDHRRELYTFFIEVDRGTMQMSRLARKLSAYARYTQYVPQSGPGRARSAAPGREAWRVRYPAFPRLLIVLTLPPGRATQRRIDDLRALAAADVHLPHARELTVGVTTLEQLRSSGPFTTIVTPVLGPSSSTDVLMTAPDRAEAA
ncbi:replication-relaxation family protein [Streptomyces sp. LHD-70]|uniref:replication-relaxation family protein n=1 Tax=Streptomyces sp. LHD-70 TaxID=3072140 RepID=UPI00280DA1EF|nr:replication-relaxation family protein [Streptomyces sp. LHD-70]MDQ8707511.1 replication-relaxation family protein [Streptomyces sp. LHD-70]